MRYYLIAGEASGDLHASNLMKSLSQCDAQAEFRFYGGDLMQAVGGTLVKHYREMAYMGFIPVLMHLPTIMRNMKQCIRDIVEWKPDVVILIDYPGFNLDIAKFVHAKTSIPVYYYISPKIWAWKEYRIKAIRRDVDEMFSILPFEVDFYRKHNYPIHYVGNPCVDAISQFLLTPEGQESREQFAAANSLSSRPIIALLAGSRRQEIKDNLRLMIAAARQFPDHQMVIAGAPNIEAEFYQQHIPADCNVRVVFGQTYRLLRASEAALVTSGTATLETAILRTPQVVCYYTFLGPLISFLRRLVLKVPFISLVNLIADREIVTELVADGMTVDNIRRELQAIVEGGERRPQMLADYDDMLRRLGESGASERAAKQIVKLLSPLCRATDRTK